jgi:uncharacterized protein
MPPVQSPCIGVCRLDPASSICLGCGRTLEEIAKWTHLDNLQKKQVTKLLEARLRRLEQARAAIGLPQFKPA